MKEKWCDIKGYKGLYQISSYGRIKSMPRKVKHWQGGYRIQAGKILIGNLSKGYRVAVLCKNGTEKRIKVHTLVGLYFVPNPYKFTWINHKDKNRLNNYYKNIEWCCRRENISHGRSGNRKSKFTGVVKHSIREGWMARIGINNESKYLGYFKNELDAANAYRKALKENGLINRYAA